MKTRHSLGLGVMETLADIGFPGPIATRLLTKYCDVFNAEQIMHLDHFTERHEASIP